MSNPGLNITSRDSRWLGKMGIATNESQSLSAELANRAVDGFPTSPITATEAALRIDLGKAIWRGDLLKADSAEREKQIFKWLDAACRDRDRATRENKLWCLLFLMLICAAFWGAVIVYGRRG